MSVNAIQQSTTNYLVPAGGTTHAVTLSGSFSSVPYLVDWRQWTVDAFPFQPQGAYCDNTLGNVDMVLTILPIGWKITVPAGSNRAVSFPAPNGQTATITGDPAVTSSVIFVDFPVFPDADGNAEVTGSAQAAGGVPYETVVQSPSPVYGSTVSLAVTDASADVALSAAAAANVTLTNAGDTLAFVNLTAAAGSADATDLPLPAGASMTVAGNNAAHMSAITASGTTTIYATLVN